MHYNVAINGIQLMNPKKEEGLYFLVRAIELMVL